MPLVLESEGPRLDGVEGDISELGEEKPSLRSVSALGISAGWTMSGAGSIVGTREDVKQGWGRRAGLRLTF